MVKGLIFDMDDTLVNSSPLAKKSFALALQKYGVDLYSIPAELEKRFFGKKNIEISKILIDFYKLPLSAKQLINEKDKFATDLLKQVKPMPGLAKLLRFLRKSDFKVALATSSVKKYVEIILKKFKMEDIFKVLITAEDVKNGKPHPEPYCLALKWLGLSAKDCRVIEDSGIGIKAAKAAKIKTFAIKNQLEDWNQDLSQADLVLENLGQIEKALKN